VTIAHLRGGPCDGQIITVPDDRNDVDVPHPIPGLWGTSAGYTVERYVRRRADLHPISFLNRWGGERIKPDDWFARDPALVSPRMLATDHLIFDHTSTLRPQRAYAEATVSLAVAAESPQALVYLACGIIDRLAAMGRFDRRDLEWTVYPTGDEQVVRMHCETVIGIP
jgi:hypothetical protein